MYGGRGMVIKAISLTASGLERSREKNWEGTGER